MPRPFRRVTILLLLLTIATPSLADLDLRLPDAWPDLPGRLLDRNTRLLLLRESGEPDSLRVASAELLAGRDGEEASWLWFEVGLNTCFAVPYPELLDAIGRRDVTILGANVAEGEVPWRLLRCIAHRHANRNAAAVAEIDTLLRRRPDWAPMLHYLRFSCLDELMRPASEYQRSLDVAAADGMALLMTLEGMVSLYSEDGEALPELDRFLAAAPSHPRVAVCRHMIRLALDWRRGTLDAETLRHQWYQTLREYDRRAWAWSGMFAWAIDRWLPAQARLPLLDELGRPPAGRRFRLRRAEALNGRGDFLWSRRVLARSSPPRDDLFLQQLLPVVAFMAPPDSQVQLLQEIRGRWLATDDTDLLMQTCHLLGRNDLWTEIWEELGREWPAAAVWHRLLAMDDRDRVTIQQFADSLRALPLLGDPFARGLERLDALVRPTVDLDAILDEPPGVERDHHLYLAFLTATRSGDEERARKVMEVLVTEGVNISVIETAIISYDSHDFRYWLGRALERLEAIGEDRGQLALLRVGYVASGRDRDALVETLREMDPATMANLLTLKFLGAYAVEGHASDVLERIVDRLRELAPDARDTRLLEAELYLMRGDREKARTILSGLRRDYPGDSDVHGRLLAVGEGIETVANIPEEPRDWARTLDRFGYELADPEQVRRLGVSGDDTVGWDAIRLLDRASLLVTGTETGLLRRRQITQVVTVAGADANRQVVIQFDPGDGVPGIRLARVLTPDGQVLPVDPGDIHVRTASDEGIDDQQEVVIPLRGVVPGAIVDVVYDQRLHAFVGTSWTWSEFFVDAIPMRRKVLEVWNPPGYPLQVLTRGDIEELPPDPETGVRRWEIRNQDPVVRETMHPALDEILPWIGLTTYRDWEQVGRGYAPLFWRDEKMFPRLRSLVDSLTRDLRTDEERAVALYRYVRSEMSHHTVEIGIGRIAPSSCREVLDRGWGDCKDLCHLLVTMLDEVGIAARPVLVATGDVHVPRREFPSFQGFDHVIVQVTGLPGNPYWDPTNGGSCPSPLPAEDTERLALHIDRDGRSELLPVPPARPEEHTAEMAVDIVPEGETSLRYEIVGRFGGELARTMEGMLSFGDTSMTRNYLDGFVGYGVALGIPVRSWSVRHLDCGHIEVTMTYVDTAWTERGAPVAYLRHGGEAAIYWGLPDSDGRQADVVMPSPYTATLEVRLHGNDHWQPVPAVVPYLLRNDHARGSISSEVRREGGRPLVVVHQEYTLGHRRVPVADYAGYRDDARMFTLVSAQLYQYRRTLSPEKLAAIEEYAREHPDDHGFVLNAVATILGKDVGGKGEEGEHRREIAMRLLEPLLRESRPPVLAILRAGEIHVRRHRFQVADSLLDAALEQRPDEVHLLLVSAVINEELEQWSDAIERLQHLNDRGGGAEYSKLLVDNLLTIGDEDGVRVQLERLRSMGTPMDSLVLALRRYRAAAYHEDYATMRKMLPDLERLGDDELDLKERRASLLAGEERYAEAAELYLSLLADMFAVARVHNNAAWYLALSGRDLERALVLADAAVALSDDDTSWRNTRATVLARMGRWQEARDIYAELFSQDQRPSERQVNGYFLGLAEVQLGHPERAREVWESIRDLRTWSVWHRRLETSLRALDEGGDVLAPIFGRGDREEEKEED